MKKTLKNFLMMELVILLYVLFHWMVPGSPHKILIEVFIFVSFGLWLGYVVTKWK